MYDILKIKSGTQGRIKCKIQNQDKTKTIKITEKKIKRNIRQQEENKGKC